MPQPQCVAMTRKQVVMLANWLGVAESAVLALSPDEIREYWSALQRADDAATD